ncbi:penicillin-binding transpeptidase domain-containing protein [Streptomyces sodiiphilus]|uniref:Penicillin-binding transpeptidase domain-containing protein n=1 Tax=Streptomyces sodiiphilus TaxID=226217 RepID=A0ABN2PV70_9ACTN
MGDSVTGWDPPGQPSRWPAHRSKIIAGAALLVTVLAVLAVLLLRTTGDSRADAAGERVADFLAAWEAGDPARAAAHTDDPEAAESLLESVRRNLGAKETALEVTGSARDAGEGAPDGAMAVPFTAVFTFEALGEWTYDSTAHAVPGPDDAPWKVHFEPALIHPRLAEGQTLMYRVEHPERAPVLAADGSELAGPSTVWDLSVWPAMLEDPEDAYEVLDGLDVGLDTEALAERVAAADPDQAVPVITLRDSLYQEHADTLTAVQGLQAQQATRPLAHAARSVIGGVDPGTGEGSHGLQGRYDEQLTGTPEAFVVIADRQTAEPVETLAEQGDGEPGTPVRTTIDPGVQRAAEEALAGLEQDASIVVVQPSTGHILAAADLPAAGPDRSLSGRLAPGSTFKVVSTAALLEDGVGPEDPVGCPKYATVDGQRFHNQNEFELGPDTTLREAFTASCNTAFIENRDRFEDGTLRDTAAAFGIGGDWDVGVSTFDGSVPGAEGANDLAASLIGQARVQASPLVLASVAATVAEGAFRQPVLVPDAVREPHRPAEELSDGTFEALRAMMRETVTKGTASGLRGVPGQAHAKTGTAEFATGEDGELSTNAWLIGFLGEGDLAFAVLLEDGGSGGSHAGPVAAALLRGLD